MVTKVTWTIYYTAISYIRGILVFWYIIIVPILVYYTTSVINFRISYIMLNLYTIKYNLVPAYSIIQYSVNKNIYFLVFEPIICVV